MENSESSIIDFKKQKINWRNKTRMRSNSNELTDNVVRDCNKQPLEVDEINLIMRQDTPQVLLKTKIGAKMPGFSI